MHKELELLRTSLPKQLQFLRTGLGWRGSYQRLQKKIQNNPPRIVIFAGTAGQLNPTLTSGQVVFPEKWCFLDGRCYRQSSIVSEHLISSGFAPQGAGLTVKSPVFTKEKRSFLYQKTGALICDMESAGVLFQAQKLQIPAVAIKVVSDTADSGISGYWNDFNENLRLLGNYLGEVIKILSTSF